MFVLAAVAVLSYRWHAPSGDARVGRPVDTSPFADWPYDDSRFRWEGLWDGEKGEHARLHVRVGPTTSFQPIAELNVTRVRECLRGRSILIVGDSLSRYQYLSLVYFIATGSWHSPCPQNSDESQWQNDVYEPGVPPGATCRSSRGHFSKAAHWAAFFAGTSERMRTPTSYELCDCFRDGSDTWPLTASENRHFFESSANLRVSNVAWLAKHPWRAHNLSWLGAACAQPPCAQSGCAPGECSSAREAWHWTAPYPHQFAVAAAQLRPDTVIVNSGAWLHIDETAERIDELLAGGEAARASGVRELYWKMTANSFLGATRSGDNPESAQLVPRVRAAGWRVFDAYALTDGLPLHMFWDGGGHFRESVYRGLNEVLLRDLMRNCM